MKIVQFKENDKSEINSNKSNKKVDPIMEKATSDWANAIVSITKMILIYIESELLLLEEDICEIVHYEIK